MKWLLKIAQVVLTALRLYKGGSAKQAIEQAAIEAVVDAANESLAPYLPKLEQAEKTFFKLEELYREVTGIVSTHSLEVPTTETVFDVLQRLDFIAKQSTIYTQAISDHIKEGPAVPETKVLDVVSRLSALGIK